MNLLETLQQHVSSNLLLIVAVVYGWYRLRASMREDAENRDEKLEDRIHKGIVAALNNGAGEPVRRIVRDEMRLALDERQPRRRGR